MVAKVIEMYEVSIPNTITVITLAMLYDAEAERFPYVVTCAQFEDITLVRRLDMEFARGEAAAMKFARYRNRMSLGVSNGFLITI